MENINDLINKVLIKVYRDNDEIFFHISENEIYKMYHNQDCCEIVNIEDITGDLNDLLNTPILLAEERTNEKEDENGSETFTFYTLRTTKGTVDIRWYGQSNGYYSENVDFIKSNNNGTFFN